MESSNFGVVKYATNSSRTFKVTAYHLEIGTEIKYYQKIDTATVYNSDFSKFPVYLACNGSNTWMRTNDINFSATDEISVFAGLRKYSDMSSILVELSVNTNINNGAFFLEVANKYNSLSKGTAPTAALQNASTPFFSGSDTAVLSSTHDISGDLSTIRRNGIAGTNGAYEKGAGNFGDYPLYLFRRA